MCLPVYGQDSQACTAVNVLFFFPHISRQRSLVPLYIGLSPGYVHEIITSKPKFSGDVSRFQANCTDFNAGSRQQDNVLQSVKYIYIYISFLTFHPLRIKLFFSHTRLVVSHSNSSSVLDKIIMLVNRNSHSARISIWEPDTGFRDFLQFLKAKCRKAPKNIPQ